MMSISKKKFRVIFQKSYFEMQNTDFFLVVFFLQIKKYILETSISKWNRVKIKPKTHAIKLVKTRHRTHYSQVLIMGTVKVVKIKV